MRRRAGMTLVSAVLALRVVVVVLAAIACLRTVEEPSASTAAFAGCVVLAVILFDRFVLVNVLARRDPAGDDPARRDGQLTEMGALPLSATVVVLALALMVIDSDTIRYIGGGLLAISYVAALRVLVVRKARANARSGDATLQRRG